MFVGRAIHLSVDIIILESLSLDNDRRMSSEKIKNYNVVTMCHFCPKDDDQFRVG